MTLVTGSKEILQVNNRPVRERHEKKNYFWVVAKGSRNTDAKWNGRAGEIKKK